MSKMRVAVIGSGVSGLVSAYVLAKAGVDVVLYKKEDYLGGHARTVTFDGVDLDLGFMVFNRLHGNGQGLQKDSLINEQYLNLEQLEPCLNFRFRPPIEAASAGIIHLTKLHLPVFGTMSEKRGEKNAL
ncbi:hypothetical protein HHK36_012913 [Tetracentron sinense]|uniref:Uncharacterized protein n=1 Tax=Tetracentron sinense TaxID=13715 RepID=A0A834ZG58_TETSI|nr:hypothetical protein HHK36_012913 [Tetracentron sinense]